MTAHTADPTNSELPIIHDQDHAKLANQGITQKHFQVAAQSISLVTTLIEEPGGMVL